MKKFLSIIIIAALALGTFSMTGVHADTAGIDSSLIFDLDFSGYDSSLSTAAKGLKNGADGTDADFAEVQIGGIGTIAGTTTKYVQMNGGSNGIKVKNAQMNNSAAMTVETWTYADEGSVNDGAAHMFLHTLEGENSSNGPRIQIMGQSTPGTKENTKKWLYRFGGSDKQVNYEQTLGEWKHMVFVRKPVDTDNDDADDSVFFAVYENGEQKAAGTWNKLTLDMSAFADAYMNIGGGTYANNRSLGYRGKFATVKIYSGAMTKEEAAAKYEATQADYVINANNMTIDQKLFFDLDTSRYDATSSAVSKGLRNAVDGGDTDFVKVKINSTATIPGTNTKYVRINGGDDTIKIKNSTLNSADALTIEAWAYADGGTANDSSAHMFIHSLEGSNSQSGPRIQIMGQANPGSKENTKKWLYRFGGTGKDVNYEQTLGEWKHMVFARKPVDTDDDNVNDAVFYAVYENGVQKAAGTWKNLTLDMTAFADAYMSIGGGGYSTSVGYKGYFGAVKFYNGAMTQSEAEEKYKATKADYIADYDGTKVVDLDFSQYNRAEKTGIVNSVSSNESTISIPSANGPKLVKETTAEGLRSYLSFRDEAGKNGNIRLKDANITGKQAISVEAWVKRPETAVAAESRHLLMFTDDVWGTNSGHSLQAILSTDKGQITVKPFGTKYKVNNLDYSWGPSYNENSQWEHWVLTRWNEDGKWNSKLYINGTEKYSVSNVAIADNAATVQDETQALENENYYMEIGGFSQRNDSMLFNGGIGSFKVFDTVLDSIYVSKAYAESKALYESEIITNTATFRDQTSAVIENLSETTTKVTAEITLKNDTGVAITPAVILAFYDNGVLGKVKLADTTAMDIDGNLFVEVSVDGIAPDANSEVKLFVWDGFDNCKPLLDVSHLQYL